MQLLFFTIIDSGVPGPAKSVVPLRYFQATSELWDWLDIVILFRLLKRNHSDTIEKYKKPSLTSQSRLLFGVFSSLYISFMLFYNNSDFFIIKLY